MTVRGDSGGPQPTEAPDPVAGPTSLDVDAASAFDVDAARLVEADSAPGDDTGQAPVARPLPRARADSLTGPDSLDRGHSLRSVTSLAGPLSRVQPDSLVQPDSRIQPDSRARPVALARAGQAATANAAALADHLFATASARDIFARAFRVVLDAGWVRRRDDLPSREATSATRFGALVRGVLEGGRAAPFDVERSVLDADAVTLLRRALRVELDACPQVDRLALVLGLMHGIDSCLGPAICAEFCAAAKTGEASVPLVGSGAFPAPIRPRSDVRPPRKGLPMDYLNLEAQFQHLSAPPSTTRPVRPALHTAGRRGVPRESPLEDPLGVAVVDVISSREELRLRGAPPVIWVEGIRQKARVYRRVDLALARLHRSGRRIDLLVMPEFAADEAITARVHAFLRDHASARGHDPYAVLGSPHERELVAGEPTGMFVNRPRVVCREGVLSWDYWKAEYYQGDLERGLGARREALGAPPDRVVAIDTPIGRLAVLMCKDFLESTYFRALQHTRATIVVVPSLTDHDSAATFLQSARRLAGSNLAVTVFANCALSAREHCHDEPDAWSNPLSFIHPSFPIDDDLCPRYCLRQGIPAGVEIPDAASIGPGVVAIYRVARPDHQHTRAAARRGTSVAPEMYWLPHDA